MLYVCVALPPPAYPIRTYPYKKKISATKEILHLNHIGTEKKCR